MRTQPSDNSKKQIPVQNISVRVLQIPCEKCGFLASISEGKYLLSFFWKALVEGCRYYRVRTICAINYFPHGVTTGCPISAGTTLCDLIRSIFVIRSAFSNYANKISVRTVRTTTGHLPANHAELKYVRAAG